MKTSIIIIMSFLAIELTAQQSYVDRAHTGHQNVRVYEGGAYEVTIDYKTSLIDLINRLEGEWEFFETGKAYWIGYTDDMYSIAARKNEAVKPLLDFINRTGSEKAKIGAVFTLHLIGIDSKIIGRFTEDFSNGTAREALLTLLENQQLGRLIVDLLSRDPWLSDIPHFMNYLLGSSSERITELLSVMQRYQMSSHPFMKKIPKELRMTEITVHTDQLYSGNPIPYLLALKECYGEKLIINNEILNSKLWKEQTAQLKDTKLFEEHLPFGLILEGLTNSDMLSSYGNLDNLFYYTYSDEIITIHGQSSALNIWRNWWANLSEDQKTSFDEWTKNNEAQY